MNWQDRITYITIGAVGTFLIVLLAAIMDFARTRRPRLCPKCGKDTVHLDMNALREWCISCGWQEPDPIYIHPRDM